MAPQSKRRRSYGSFTKKKIPVAPTVKKYVKKCMDRLIDDKYATLQLSNPTSAANTPTVFGSALLGGIQQGTSDGTRVGNLIRVKKITFKGTVTNTTSDRIRILFAWDKQTNGAAPAGGEIITVNDVHGPYNHDTIVGEGGGRFDVLYDHIHVIKPPFSGSLDNHEISFTWAGDKVVRYDTNGGTIADIVSNNFFGVILPVLGSAAGSSLTGYFDVMFNDA